MYYMISILPQVNASLPSQQNITRLPSPPSTLPFGREVLLRNCTKKQAENGGLDAEDA
jgi:hypothetical protein